MTDRADRAGPIAPPPLLTLLCILAALGAERLARLPLVDGFATARGPSSR